MAGSYSHVVTNNRGKLLNRKNFEEMIEKPSDAYQATEEMYGMIHYLAARVELLTPEKIYQTPEQIVEEAQKNYRHGIKMSPGRQSPLRGMS